MPPIPGITLSVFLTREMLTLASVTKPIKVPGTTGPIKATEDQKVVKVDRPTTGLPEKKNSKPLAKKEDEFEGEDDEDAISALEELARSSQPEKSQTVSASQEAAT